MSLRATPGERKVNKKRFSLVPKRASKSREHLEEEKVKAQQSTALYLESLMQDFETRKQEDHELILRLQKDKEELKSLLAEAPDVAFAVLNQRQLMHADIPASLLNKTRKDIEHRLHFDELVAEKRDVERSTLRLNTRLGGTQTHVNSFLAEPDANYLKALRHSTAEAIDEEDEFLDSGSEEDGAEKAEEVEGEGELNRQQNDRESRRQRRMHERQKSITAPKIQQDSEESSEMLRSTDSDEEDEPEVELKKELVFEAEEEPQVEERGKEPEEEAIIQASDDEDEDVVQASAEDEDDDEYEYVEEEVTVEENEEEEEREEQQKALPAKRTMSSVSRRTRVAASELEELENQLAEVEHDAVRAFAKAKAAQKQLDESRATISELERKLRKKDADLDLLHEHLARVEGESKEKGSKTEARVEQLESQLEALMGEDAAVRLKAEQAKVVALEERLNLALSKLSVKDKVALIHGAESKGTLEEEEEEEEEQEVVELSGHQKEAEANTVQSIETLYKAQNRELQKSLKAASRERKEMKVGYELQVKKALNKIHQYRARVEELEGECESLRQMLYDAQQDAKARTPPPAPTEGTLFDTEGEYQTLYKETLTALHEERQQRREMAVTNKTQMQNLQERLQDEMDTAIELRERMQVLKAREAELAAGYRTEVDIAQQKVEQLQKQLAIAQDEDRWSAEVEELKKQVADLKAGAFGDVHEEYERDKQMLLEKQIQALEENDKLREKLKRLDWLREKYFFSLCLSIKLSESLSGSVCNINPSALWPRAQLMSVRKWQSWLQDLVVSEV